MNRRDNVWRGGQTDFVRATANTESTEAVSRNSEKIGRSSGYIFLICEFHYHFRKNPRARR